MLLHRPIRICVRVRGWETASGSVAAASSPEVTADDAA